MIKGIRVSWDEGIIDVLLTKNFLSFVGVNLCGLQENVAVIGPRRVASGELKYYFDYYCYKQQRATTKRVQRVTAVESIAIIMPEIRPILQGPPSLQVVHPAHM